MRNDGYVEKRLSRGWKRLNEAREGCWKRLEADGIAWKRLGRG